MAELLHPCGGIPATELVAAVIHVPDLHEPELLVELQKDETRRGQYERVEVSVRYAMACDRNGDEEGELMALRHVVGLTVELLSIYYEPDDEVEAVHDEEVVA